MVQAMEEKLAAFGLSAFAEHPYAPSLLRLCTHSAYARLHLDILLSILNEGLYDADQPPLDYASLLDQIPKNQPRTLYAKALRRFRHYHLLGIWLQQKGGGQGIKKTLRHWSTCTDALILHAIAFCTRELSLKYGQPTGDDGAASTLYTLGMGKLGGRELNFSSDIDLIFCYDKSGFTDGDKQVDNQQYFTLLIQRVCQLLQENTVDGFVFRVDLRLRPFGESGPLVMSLTAMETYYQEQGRDWERYAMVKARVLGHEHSVIIEQCIRPFVYRSYLDYSVIESLRSMKSMIEKEIILNPRLDDIKRGCGGIREIEFIIQNIQLIRGGRMPSIRDRNASEALQLLGKEKLLKHWRTLSKIYLFYRDLENALQIQNDAQTHRLSDDASFWVRTSALLDMDGRVLQQKIKESQHIVSQIFQSVLGEAASFEDEKRVYAKQLRNLWHGHIEREMAMNWMATVGCSEPQRSWQLIDDFRLSSKVRRLPQIATQRLERFMIILLDTFFSASYSAEVMHRIISLLDTIVNRSAYLALLSEKPRVLQEILEYFEKSSFISKLVMRNPFLLEVFIDYPAEWKPWSVKKLQDNLQKELEGCEDEEQRQERLRQFKCRCTLLLARAELCGAVDGVRAGQFLSDLACVLFEQVCHMGFEQIRDRYPELYANREKFAVFVYGKAGSREMNYNSDLDLVFVHQLDIHAEQGLNRLTQKILHFLTVRTQTGVLYTVDTRLRPSGSAGLLITSWKAFESYQKEEAWTWEHQALIKARKLYGARAFSLRLAALKKKVITHAKKGHVLWEDVQQMREKVGYKKNDVKYQKGGLLDIEFFAQFLMLNSSLAPKLDKTDTLSLLKVAVQSGSLHHQNYATLKRVVQEYHQYLRQSLLQDTAEYPEVRCDEVQNCIQQALKSIEK